MLPEPPLSPRSQAGIRSAVQVLLADQQGLFASGLKAMLQLYVGASVHIQGFEDRQILAEARKGAYNLLLLNLQSCSPDILDMINRIRKSRPSLRILAVTDARDAKLLAVIRSFRVSGIISQAADPQQLVQAIDQLMAGQSYLCPQLQHQMQSLALVKGQVLTRREREILCLIGREYTSEEISQSLFISKGTVDTHRKNLIAKLRVRNAVGLALYALRNRLVG